jgi:small subunit ribosomal protein S20
MAIRHASLRPKSLSTDPATSLSRISKHEIRSSDEPIEESHFMANTSSAKKAARQMIRRTEINKSRRSRLKTTVRKVEEAIASGKQSDAMAALKAAEPELMRSAQKGILDKKAASRKVSRLTARVKKLEA